MSWMEVGLVGSIVFALHYFQQIKITLKERGYEVTLLTGWLSDYRRFKELLRKEKDQRLQIKYQGILNGLHLALGGLVVIATLMASR